MSRPTRISRIAPQYCRHTISPLQRMRNVAEGVVDANLKVYGLVNSILFIDQNVS